MKTNTVKMLACAVAMLISLAGCHHEEPQLEPPPCELISMGIIEKVCPENENGYVHLVLGVNFLCNNVPEMDLHVDYNGHSIDQLGVYDEIDGELATRRFRYVISPIKGERHVIVTFSTTYAKVMKYVTISCDL